MAISDRNTAKALTEKLKASLPIKVKPGKEFLKTLKQKKQIVDPEQEFEVDFIGDFGDEGGIMCGLVSTINNPTDEEKYIVSLTHLKIDSNHSLADEVQAYQRRRIRQLMIQEGGFRAELMTLKPPKNNNSGKGFGK